MLVIRVLKVMLKFFNNRFFNLFIIILNVSGFISQILPYMLKISVPNLYKIIDNIDDTNIMFYVIDLWLILWLLLFLFELIFFYLFTYDIIKLPNNKRVPKLLINFLRTQKPDSELHRDKHLNIVRSHLTFISMTCFLLLIINFFHLMA